MKKIGIYGGSFDPIHHGHLILARDALEQLELDQMIFVPANISPFKESTHASPEMRLSMLRAAVAEESHFSAYDCEVRRPPPSYTIDTVDEIRAREPDAEFTWLVGEDHVEDLPNWRRFDDWFLNRLRGSCFDDFDWSRDGFNWGFSKRFRLRQLELVVRFILRLRRFEAFFSLFDRTL